MERLQLQEVFGYRWFAVTERLQLQKDFDDRGFEDLRVDDSQSRVD